MGSKSFIFSFADVQVREREFSLIKAGETVAVEPKAFRVLLILLRNPKKLISKEELLNAVWGETAVTENSLTRAIALLRRLLGDDVHSPRFIETVPTVGYRWLGPVERVEDPAGAAAEATELAAEPTDALEAASAAAPARSAPAKAAGRVRWAGLLAAGAGLAILLAGTLWYLSRPLPPPHIISYTQITHDGRGKSLAATDGSRLYFTEFSPGSIEQVSVNGGEIAPLPIAAPGAVEYLMDISPDGSNALIGTLEPGHPGMGQWVVPVLGGAARRLEDSLRQGQLGYDLDGTAFSPDGASVIYANMSGDIFMARIDGTGKHKLAGVGSFAAGFNWSPDGKVIRFYKQDGLWEMSDDGAGAHSLLSGWKKGISSPCCGRWTQDGKFYLFVGGGEQIFAIDERRSILRQPPSQPVQLTDGPIHWRAPIPSKDGRTIFAVGRTPRGELVRIGKNVRSPELFLGGISAEYVSFSPDGRSVVYVSFPEGTLWRANRDGSNRVELTRPPDQVINPRWSPDSNEIVFLALSPEGHGSIHRVSAADGTPLWLQPEEVADTMDPNWSPDGKRVLFAIGPVGWFNREKQALRIVDLETRKVTVLPGSDSMRSPRWSPDGRYVLAIRGFAEGLHVFDSAAQTWSTLAVANVNYPWFSHDSRFVYFLRFGQDQGVFRIPVAGGKEERVADMTNWHLTGFMGFSMTLDPDDAPLILRDTGSNDIYALTLEEK